MEEKNTIETLLSALADFLGPLKEAAESGSEGIVILLDEAGLVVLDDSSELQNENLLTDLVKSVGEIWDALEPFLDGVDIGNLPEIPNLLNDIFDLIEDFNGLSELGDFGDIAGEIGKRLFQFLFIRYLQDYPPGLYSFSLSQDQEWSVENIPQNNRRGLYHFLLLIGVITEGNHQEQDFPEIDFGYFNDLFSDPGSIPEKVYGWGSAVFDAYLFLFRLRHMLWCLGVPSFFHYPDPNHAEKLEACTDLSTEYPVQQLRVPIVTQKQDGALAQTGASLLPLPVSDSEPGIAVVPFGVASLSETIPLGDQWQFIVEASADVTVAFGIEIRPGSVAITPLEGDGFTSLNMSATIERQVPVDETKPLLALPGGLRLELGTVGLQLGFDYDGSEADFHIALPMRGGRFVISPPEQFGFLKNVLPSDGIEVTFDITLGLSSKRGLFFEGAAALELEIPLNISILEVIELESIYLAAQIDDEGFCLIVAATATLEIGPIAAGVERIGLKARLLPSEDGREPGLGEFILPLGPMDLALGFKPPTGLYISVDAGPIAGGGFIRLEPDKGRYSGMLYLEIFELSITAIGILDTRGPGGKSLPPPGFSFLIIICVELPPIQLGFGFTLNGVGGLAGIHRTIVTKKLQTGLRKGAVDHIMFPKDPIKNAPTIISSLQKIFPPKENRFVFGPMAILAWGGATPLIRAEIGLIIELPPPLRLVLLGQLSVTLPKKKKAVVSLNVDVLGIFDAERKFISIDAALRDSKVAGFSVSGEMALRLSWADPPLFAFSVGGLHPHFQPPPKFPKLKRLTISMGWEDNPRISLQAYFALTSNSIQFGASARLSASLRKVSVEGGAGFDALVEFSPFFFRVDLGAYLKVIWGSKQLASIYLAGHLRGPNPFYVSGKASVSVWIFDVTVDFEVTFGKRKELTPLKKKNAWAVLKPAIEDERNWSASLPPNFHTVVTIRKPADAPERVLVHPMGTVTLRQKAVPFNRRLEKLGAHPLKGSNRFNLEGVCFGDYSTSDDWLPVKEHFAPNQFEYLSEHEKLNRDSFEKMMAGFTVGSDRIGYGKFIETELEYETAIVDSPWESRAPEGDPFQLRREHQRAMSRRGAKARSALRRQYAPDAGRERAFALKDEGYVIACTSNLRQCSNDGIKDVMTKGEAYQALKEHLADNPQDRGRLQVVPIHEVNKVCENEEAA